MQGRDVAMNIEDSVGGRPWPMGHTKWGKNGINPILKSENGKKNGARIAINSGYSTQLVPRCLCGELPP